VPSPHRYNMPIQILTPTQQWTVALTRHIMGNLSVVASCIIVYQVVLRILQSRRSQRRDLVTPYHRLMLGFSVADILYSFWVGLSTLVVPASSGVIYGFGTTATCSTQGFFLQFGAATHLYIAILSLYFLLKIRYNVTDDTLYHRYEMWFHAIPWVVAIGTGSLGVASQVYNPMIVPDMGCWVGPFPTDCLDPGGPPCTRGYKTDAQGSLYSFILAFCWLFASFVVVLVSNILIYRTVRCQERRNEQYLGSQLQAQSSIFALPVPEPTTRWKHDESSPPVASDGLPVTSSEEKIAAVCEIDGTERDSGAAPEQGRTESSTAMEHPGSREDTSSRRRQSASWQSAKASRTAATQSILYVSSAGFTVVWIFLPFFFYKLGLPNGWLFFAVLTYSAFAPMQGVFNLMIFVRPEYLRLRGSRRDFSRLQCVRSCLFSPDLRDPRLFKSKRQLAHQSARAALRSSESHMSKVPVSPAAT
jgi:hypothetical protein